MKEYDTVALKTKLHDLPPGTVGVIVHEHVRGEEFIVEFINTDGSTRALADISANDLVLVKDHDPNA